MKKHFVWQIQDQESLKKVRSNWDYWQALVEEKKQTNADFKLEIDECEEKLRDTITNDNLQPDKRITKIHSIWVELETLKNNKKLALKDVNGRIKSAISTLGETVQNIKQIEIEFN